MHAWRSEKEKEKNENEGRRMREKAGERGEGKIKIGKE